MWWGKKGKFLGFFSQHRPFHFPVSEELAGSPSLPYDITEVSYVINIHAHWSSGFVGRIVGFIGSTDGFIRSTDGCIGSTVGFIGSTIGFIGSTVGFIDVAP